MKAVRARPLVSFPGLPVSDLVTGHLSSLRPTCTSAFAAFGFPGRIVNKALKLIHVVVCADINALTSSAFVWPSMLPFQTRPDSGRN
jgi:hypothetical protein